MEGVDPGAASGVDSQGVEPGHQGIEAAPAAEVTVSVPGLRELALGAGSPRRVSRSCSFAAGRSGPGLARALGLQGVDLALLAPGLDGLVGPEAGGRRPSPP